MVRNLGPIEVCRRLRAGGHPVSVVMAYALEGALTGCHWQDIPWETKQFLRVEFAKVKIPGASPGAFDKTAANSSDHNAIRA